MAKKILTKIRQGKIQKFARPSFPRNSNGHRDQRSSVNDETRRAKPSRTSKRAARKVLLMPGQEEPTLAEELIKKGKDRGFLTQDDILSVFPEAESNLEQLEELYIVLFDEGI